MAFIDTDGFLFSPEGQKLNHVMREYRECAAIGVNRVMYGTSQVQHVPEGHKIVDHLVYRSELSDPVNQHIKSIVRPNWVQKCVSPHYFILNFGAKTLNENKQPIEGAFSNKSVNNLRINHYWSRDMDFFLTEKLIRRKIWLADPDKQINEEKTYNVVYDPILTKQ